VVRWEMRPRLFLRTLEFLWQEGHTAHATKEEAENMVRTALEIYRRLNEEVLAIHVVLGRKSDTEKFAGAEYTTTVEALMRDGKALQMGTSHHLGQNFAKAFGIEFLNERGEKEYAWQTSWGASTRLIGGLIMAHGNEKGLILAPRIAPVQVVIIPIGKTPQEAQSVREVLEKVVRPKLSDINVWDEPLRFQIDDRPEQTPGWKFNHWEVKGVPLRIEIGPQDVTKSSVMIVCRDRGVKESVAFANFSVRVAQLLSEMQSSLLQSHRSFTEEYTAIADTLVEMKKKLIEKGGFVRAPWCGRGECELKVKEETKATIRVVQELHAARVTCCACREQAESEPYFAVAY